jgi:hypothetical protein
LTQFSKVEQCGGGSLFRETNLRGEKFEDERI